MHDGDAAARSAPWDGSVVHAYRRRRGRESRPSDATRDRWVTLLLCFPRPSLIDFHQLRVWGVTPDYQDGPLSFLYELHDRCFSASLVRRLAEGKPTYADYIRADQTTDVVDFILPMPSFAAGFSTVGFTVAKQAEGDVWSQPFLHDPHVPDPPPRCSMPAGIHPECASVARLLVRAVALAVVDHYLGSLAAFFAARVPSSEYAAALHYAVHYEAEADGGMYAAAVDGAAAGVCVARCVYPCLFPGEDADWGGVWDGDAEARQLARLRGCVGDMAGVGPDDYLLGLACADDDPRDDEVGDAAAHGLLGAGF